VIGVDNAIGKVLDPVFVGYASTNQYQAVMKTVEREAENEPVGLVVQKNGVTEVVEYSELPDEIRKAR
jgi:UDP-N-acetylglucosamine/UDP-N-acetylgalactosamine diphosphorylase